MKVKIVLLNIYDWERANQLEKAGDNMIRIVINDKFIVQGVGSLENQIRSSRKESFFFRK